MIWQNPWAWAGLVTVALPVLIHLLGRGRVRVQPFPTLRFLEPSRRLPTRRSRIHDLPLLVVRAAVLVAAVAALAQPLLRTASRTRALGRSLARAIVVDTSASMRRPTPAGARAIDAARREARRLAAEAQTSVMLEASAPARAVAGALAWLARQPGRRELVIVSDFQRGALDATDLAPARRPVSMTTGVRLVRIAVSSTPAPLETRLRRGGVEITALVRPSTDRTETNRTQTERTDVEWRARVAACADSVAGGEAIVLLAGPEEQASAAAALRAASTIGVPLPADTSPADTSRAVAIVYPTFDRRAELLRQATALRAPWAVDVTARLRSDSLLQVAAASAGAFGGAGDARTQASDAAAERGLVVARTETGSPVVVAAQGAVQPGGHESLLLFSRADAGSLVSAALIAAVGRARAVAPPAGELEPATLPDSVLRAWERTPAAAVPARTEAGATTGASDARWGWVVALLLLALETWLRRESRPARPAAVAEEVHERVA